jgi:ADP-ribosylglycohydrolase
VEGCTDVLAARPILYEKFLEYNGQDPWEVVTLTLAIFKVSRGDIRQCMIGGTNIGRDSDTISSQAALLAAGISGSAAIPADLLAFLPQKAVDSYRARSDAMLELICEKSVRSLELASIFTVS